MVQSRFRVSYAFHFLHNIVKLIIICIVFFGFEDVRGTVYSFAAETNLNYGQRLAYLHYLSLAFAPGVSAQLASIDASLFSFLLESG